MARRVDRVGVCGFRGTLGERRPVEHCGCCTDKYSAPAKRNSHQMADAHRGATDGDRHSVAYSDRGAEFGRGEWKWGVCNLQRWNLQLLEASERDVLLARRGKAVAKRPAAMTNRPGDDHEDVGFLGTASRPFVRRMPAVSALLRPPF